MAWTTPQQDSVGWRLGLSFVVKADGKVNHSCAKQVVALEALLEPGDSLIFPAKWAHHTESLDNSISVTYRLGPVRPATARLAGVLRPHRACHSVVRCLLA